MQCSDQKGTEAAFNLSQSHVTYPLAQLLASFSAIKRIYIKNRLTNMGSNSS